MVNQPVRAAVIVRNLANSCPASFLSRGAHSLFSPFTLIAKHLLVPRRVFVLNRRVSHGGLMAASRFPLSFEGATRKTKVFGTGAQGEQENGRDGQTQHRLDHPASPGRYKPKTAPSPMLFSVEMHIYMCS